MDFSIKKLHFKFYRYILSRSYPFDHWLLLLTSYLNLWFYSIIFSSIFCFIFETTFVEYMKFYFVINFFFMIYIVLSSYKLDFFRLVLTSSHSGTHLERFPRLSYNKYCFKCEIKVPPCFGLFCYYFALLRV